MVVGTPGKVSAGVMIGLLGAFMLTRSDGTPGNIYQAKSALGAISRNGNARDLTRYDDKYYRIISLPPVKQAYIMQNYECRVEGDKSALYKGRLDDPALGRASWVKNLPCAEARRFSSNGEDGVLAAILAVLNINSGFFLEFYAESADVAATRFLRTEPYEWRGVLFDNAHSNRALGLYHEMVTPANIVPLMQQYRVPQSLDLLALATGCYDFWLLRNLLQAGYRPRVLMLEVNAKWMTDTSVTIPHPDLVGGATPTGKCGFTDWFGASVQAFSILAGCHGYQLVYCEKHGMSCFFVLSELLPFEDAEAAKNLLSAKNLWQPPSYGIPTGGWPTDHQGRPFLLVRSCEDISEPEKAHELTQREAQHVVSQAAATQPGQAVPFFTRPVRAPQSFDQSIRHMGRQPPAVTRPRHMCPGGDESVASRTVPEFEICLHPAGDVVSDHFRRFGNWMPCTPLPLYIVVAQLATRTSDQPANVIEVGGNIGACTLELASRGSHVTVIEPVKRNADLMAASIELNSFKSRVSLHHGAAGPNTTVGEVPTEVMQGTAPEQDGESSPAKDVSWVTAKAPVYALDDLQTLANLPERVHFLKLSNQGSEYEALLGARKLLAEKRVDVIHMTFNPTFLRRRGRSGVQLLQLLSNAGFKLLQGGRPVSAPEFLFFEDKTVAEIKKGAPPPSLFAINTDTISDEHHSQFR